MFKNDWWKLEMPALTEAFEERLAEVETYLDFLQVVEERAQAGPPKLEGADQPISVVQQKILYSSVYLQLYNLVESTMTRCLNAVAAAARDGDAWLPGDLTMALRREWVRATARTHVELTPENRLESALALCTQLVSALPISQFSIEKSGGSWDDEGIEKICARVGFQLHVSPEVYRGIKRKIRDDLGPLGLVKQLRNRLAHGDISFSECAEETTVAQLRDLKERTVGYLREVVSCVVAFVDGFEFLVPERRPVQPV